MATLNILSGLDQLKKNFDMQYDFYKHLTTISSGAIVIIVAFVKQSLQAGQKVVIVSAIVCFLISIVTALLVMLNVGVQSQDIGNLSVKLGLGATEKETEGHRNKIDRQWGVIDTLAKLVTIFFGLGMLAAIIFFVLSVI